MCHNISDWKKVWQILNQKKANLICKTLKMCHNISDWKKVWQILNQKKANLILIL